MIDGVVIEKLKIFADERGKVMHMLRCDSPLFIKFGEIYFSVVYSGAIKAWKKHNTMTQSFAVPIGKIKLVMYDGRDGSPTKGRVDEVKIGEDNYVLIRIPPKVWYGFQAISDVSALIANCADTPYSPNEAESKLFSDTAIPYTWK